MERAIGIEPTTFSLGRFNSTAVKALQEKGPTRVEPG